MKTKSTGFFHFAHQLDFVCSVGFVCFALAKAESVLNMFDTAAQNDRFVF